MVTPEGMAQVAGGHVLLPRRADAPGLILLPGIEGDSRVFFRQHPLAQQRGVLALDLPPSCATVHEAAEVLLDRIPSRRFVVFGASLGGLVGWAMSLLAPERVSGLLALGTLPGPGWIPAGMSWQRAVVSRLPRAAFGVLYRRRIRARLREEGVAEGTAAMLLSGLPERDVLTGRLAMISRWGLAAPPPVPWMWLRGQVDREVAWTLSDAERTLGGGLVQLVPGGHRAHLTHPAALHGFIEHFLRGVR